MLFDEALKVIAQGLVQTGNSMVDMFCGGGSLTVGSGRVLSVADLLGWERSVLLTGAPGSGKTTVLRFLTQKSAEKYLDQPEGTSLAIPVVARQLAAQLQATRGSNPVGLLKDVFPGQVTHEALHHYLHTGRITLLVDGLDEVVDLESRYAVSEMIEQLAVQYRAMKIIVATRPLFDDTLLSSFDRMYIQPLTPNEVDRFIRCWSGETELVDRFLSLLSKAPPLATISASPLILRVLWEYFVTKGAFPEEGVTSLYGDLVQYYTYRAEKYLASETSMVLSQEDRDWVLGHLSTMMFKLGTTLVSKDQLMGLVRQKAPSVVQVDLSPDLIYRADGQVGFVNFSLQEYHMARHVLTEPECLRVLSRSPSLSSVVVMAAQRAPDVDVIAGELLDMGEIFVAAQCLGHGSTQNSDLVAEIRDRIAKAVGPNYAQIFGMSQERSQTERSVSNPFGHLRHLWQRVLEPDLKNAEKGKRLEEFTSQFLGTVFPVLGRNVHTQVGEIDIIVELRVPPVERFFWERYGADALVECKNWETNVGPEKVNHLLAKAEKTRSQIAFIVSSGGFTVDALSAISEITGMKEKPLIVPVNGQDIEDALRDHSDLYEAIKRWVRRTIWRDRVLRPKHNSKGKARSPSRHSSTGGE